MENVQEKKKPCEMKTDLDLLLECLKYQMDNPDSQKEVLVTIYSVCQQNSDASDYFREIGGLMLVSNLAKSSTHSIVKEAALFTLGALAESNVYCQQMLCTSELFSDLILASSNNYSSLNLKRMSVYIILVLISNNKAGQTLARETGCIDILLRLFRETLSIAEINQLHVETSSYQLWSSVCSTLCACANNPQNDENQKKCCTVFPYANQWLQNVIAPEIVRPICSFIGLTVANNASVQEYFAYVGGIDTLADLLLKLVDDSHTNNSSAKLSVVVTKTLDACIADNPAIGIVLSKHHIVSSLLKLLLNESLDTGDKFSIILTLGHCTEDCEENQYDLLKNNGLPLMIQILTESQDEEINKAITFVLQNCKQITEDLSLRLNEQSSNVNDSTSLEDKQRKGRNISDYWKKAKEILQRIELLERQQEEDMKCSFQTIEPLNSTQKALSIGVKKANCYPQPKEMSPTKNTLNDKLHTMPCFSQRPSEADGNLLSKQSPNDKLGKQLYYVTPGSFKKSSQQCSATKTNEEVGTHRDNLLMERVRRQIFVDDDMEPASITEKRSDHLRMKACDGKVHTVERHKKMCCMQSDASVCNALVSNHINNPALETDHVNIAKIGNKENRSSVAQSTDKIETADNADKRHVCEAACSAPQISEHVFKHPVPVPRKVKQKAYIDPFTLCSDLIDSEICSILSSSKPTNLRCSGCRAIGTSLNSRTFCKILHRCPYQCDRHRVILEAEERYKRELRKSVIYDNGSSAAYKNIQLTPFKKETNYDSCLQNQHSSHQKFQNFMLTPIKNVKASTSNSAESLQKHIRLS